MSSATFFCHSCKVRFSCSQSLDDPRCTQCGGDFVEELEAPLQTNVQPTQVFEMLSRAALLSMQTRFLVGRAYTGRSTQKSKGGQVELTPRDEAFFQILLKAAAEGPTTRKQRHEEHLRIQTEGSLKEKLELYLRYGQYNKAVQLLRHSPLQDIGQLNSQSLIQLSTELQELRRAEDFEFVSGLVGSFFHSNEDINDRNVQE